MDKGIFSKSDHEPAKEELAKDKRVSFIVGKNYHPAKITDWNIYLNIAKSAFMKRYNNIGPSYLCRDHFHMLLTIGYGKCSKIVLAAEVSNEIYVLKVMSKKKLAEFHLMDQVNKERDILNAVRFPFVINLIGVFQDNDFLYFVLPLMVNGKFSKFLEREKKISENNCRFYSAQILMALEYLHNLDILFRNLSPESILIDHFGYLKLYDFGLSKISTERTFTICGMPEYIAPEMLTNVGYGKSVDWWAFGVFIYKLRAGYTPFDADTDEQMYQHVLESKKTFSPKFGQLLKDLITELLQVDLTRRFGNLANGVDDIKQHKWFGSINWMKLVNGLIEKSEKKPPTIYPEEYLSLHHLQVGDEDLEKDFKDF